MILIPRNYIFKILIFIGEFFYLIIQVANQIIVFRGQVLNKIQELLFL